MKLSIETYVLHKRYGDKKAIQMLKKAGFDSIDYSFYWLEKSDENEVLGDKYREYAQRDMTCNQAHAPFALKYGCKFDDSDQEYVKLVRSIESAAVLGAESIVVHAIKTPPDVDSLAYNFEFYKSLEPYCERFGICVAIENLFWYDAKSKCNRGLPTPESLNRMVTMLQSPYFVVCIDVGHAAITGYEPQDLIRRFDNKVLKALHIHDNDYIDDMHTLPYAGRLDWKNIMCALKDIDYKGDFTFEIFAYLGRIDDELMDAALAFSAETGRHLMGMQFSECENEDS